jgi:release factor glutamine methyltransferase
VTETALALARKAGEHLNARGIPNGRLEAELLLAAVLGLKRLDLYLQHDRPVEADEVEAYRASVRRRLRGEPIQYITGEAAFRTLMLKVDRRALIPRPETEVLVGEVLAWAGGRPDLAALDVGTGTGAIALALAIEGGLRRVVATDSSTEALGLARENAERMAARAIEFREGASFAPLQPGERFDIVVSNPPYVAERERESLPVEVREHEPAGALFADRDGLGVILDLVAGAPALLRPGGLLALEIGAGQAAAVTAVLESAGPFTGVRLVRDLCGVERVVLAEMKR